ncbi:MAG: hypothetical protein BGO10_03995 [Chlamydia sp. 32-24]|nr:MAG: hypothetical protein BGO10_03995 [Chlamydia sp. 32-24]
MTAHHFIIQPGIWIGQGSIRFLDSDEIIRFYTKWNIEKENDGLKCVQQVELDGVEEHVINKMFVNTIEGDNFAIVLDNAMLGKISGKGVINTKTIAWEFRGHAELEGFEIYEIQENGDYLFHAEYLTGTSHRTIVDGRIWKKG